ncbi:MAG: glycosyltransferase family 4 protein [Clostridia bacterium]|nr:glycosyltransferase family 4 protein [Clostridia bacterium]
MIKVLMAGVDRSTKGGMWSVVENYLQDAGLSRQVQLRYIPTAAVGSKLRKAACFAWGMGRILLDLILRRPDVVHLHVSERGSVRRKAMIASAARFFRSKVILHMHGAEFESWYASLDEAAQTDVKRFLQRADSILILGGYWRDFVGGLLETEDKLRVLYNAVAVPENNGYRPENREILFLGEVGERKGAYDLLEAMQRIDAQLPPDNHLVLYGPNPDGDIEQRIRTLGLDERVQYCGWADRQQREAAFAAAAVNVLPSYHEGLPMTILEAMARGVPCITTPVAAIPEAVDDQTGALVSPGDVQQLAQAILQLLSSPEERKIKSEQAYRRARERFSLESHCAQLMSIYQELAGPHA